nr:hypothetical protein [Tanacetum cinerariifolium]
MTITSYKIRSNRRLSLSEQELEKEAKTHGPRIARDVLGVVATLGKVNDDNLSRAAYFIVADKAALKKA